MIRRSRLSASVLGLAALALLGMAAAMRPAAGEFGGDPYPLDTCPVSGEKLEAVIGDLVATPRSVIDRVGQFMK